MPGSEKSSNVNDEHVASTVDFVFSAVDMSKDEIKAIENLSKTETPVVSNNIIPFTGCSGGEEENPEQMLSSFEKTSGNQRGFIENGVNQELCTGIN